MDNDQGRNDTTTCIVGIEQDGVVIIGGDSAGSDGYSKTIRADEKVFSTGHIIFGFCGSFRVGQLLRYSLAIPRLPEKKEELDRWMATDFIDSVRQTLVDGGAAFQKNKTEAIPSQFLVGVNGRLYCVEEDYQIAKTVAGYQAIGSGADLAHGALHITQNLKNPKRRIIGALQAAADHTAFVAPPFHLVESGP